MPYSKRIKLISGTITVAVALGAGSALAQDGEDEVPLEDPITLTENPDQGPSLVLKSLDDNGESVASPFESAVSAESVESVESVQSVDSPASVDSVSVDSPESSDSVSADSPASVDSPDSTDSPESADSPDSVDSVED